MYSVINPDLMQRIYLISFSYSLKFVGAVVVVVVVLAFNLSDG